MVRMLKVSVERKTFLVRLEGEHEGNWCSITEHSRGSVYVLGFEKEEVGWLIEHLMKAIAMKSHLGFKRKYRGKFCVHLMEVCFNNHGRFIRISEFATNRKPTFLMKKEDNTEWKGLSTITWVSIPIFVNVIRDKGPRRGGLVPVGRWVCAVVCECNADSVKWVEVGQAVVRRILKIEGGNTVQLRRWSPKENLEVEGKFRGGHHSFRPNLSGHLSIRPSLSLAISHSGHQSLFSEPREKTFSGQSNRRKKIHRRQLFRRRFFSTPQGAPGGDLQFSQTTGAKTIHAPSTRFFRPATASHTPAREPLSGDALPPPGSPDADQPPFLPVFAIRALHVPLLGFFCLRGPSDQFFRRPRLFFLNSNPCTCLGKCSSTFPVHDKIRNGIITMVTICVAVHLRKGKDEYLTGEAAMPETTEPGFRKWKIENSMIMSWLINSMNNDIGENFLLFGTAKDIWDAAKETYSSSENISELFQVESALHDFRQGEQTVTQYYNTLTREAFSEVRREESRKKVMMGSKEQPAPTLDASALAARSFNSSGGDRQKRDRPWCDYSTVDRDGRAHVAANSESTSVPEPSPFNKEQMEMLQKLLSQVGSGSTTGVAFTANRGGMKPWIVDTGASDHMTGDAAILQNYKPSNGHSSVHIADGSKSKIAGTGSIKLTKDLYLDSVLHVPNLDCNLLSISKLACDLQCVTKFYPNSCVFQDLKSGKMIGSAELCSGLYLLSCGQFSNQVSQASCVQSQSMLESFNSVSNSKVNKDSEIIMLHYRLGHPSFVYLAKLFPKLFINKNPASYHCEICQFAKHTRTVYPQIPYKPSTVFSLVHSDVWGPSRIKNISGTRWFVTFVDDHTRVTWVFLMKEKSEVGHIFQTFNLMVQNQFNSKIQVLKSDNAKEYFTSSLSTYLQNHGIIHISSCVDTPQQNGVAERKNRHLLEVARCLMFSSNVPNYFWGKLFSQLPI
ncbi:Retrovirus-related Pol polyprotein from transposon RE2 [Vitis vinifera]|uniref:Retrovirus-related Pol polyprotein from transposon RE2 n=1 Tax=Vitis vinifera TaxID=29760 RepID=A0A438HLC9_VITVI|nr:Retrovirus-related Pol polyprotein from transposon RE2 [Vitis vinifera]